MNIAIKELEKTKEDISFDVDEEGFLRDKTGNLVVDDFGKEIKLSEEQILKYS